MLLLQVLEGSDLLDPRNDTEQKKLKKVMARQSSEAKGVHHRTVPSALSPLLPLSQRGQPAFRIGKKWLPVHALQKPDSFRLACQLNVGDGENSGTLKFRTKPK
jgi:hypothetical protein